ncbi:MAG: DUF1491 family protein [Hyphomicrobiales bacterium]
MRLKSSLWVSAYLRRAHQAGAFGAVVRHGDDDAGAVFIKIVAHSGEEKLFGPAPVYVLEPGEGRKWQRISPENGKLDEFLERERSFDPDLWVVEIEDRDGRDFLHETELHIPE